MKINIVNEAVNYEIYLTHLLQDTAKGKKYKKSETWWLGDIADHLKICSKIITNNGISPTQLSKLLWNLDADSREKFPAKFFKYADSE